MKNINKDQTFYIDFDGVILDTMPIYRYIRAKYNLKGDDSTLFRYLNVSDVINRKRAINNLKKKKMKYLKLYCIIFIISHALSCCYDEDDNINVD